MCLHTDYMQRKPKEQPSSPSSHVTITTVALAQPQTLPMHSMGMDAKAGLSYFLDIASRLVAGYWPSGMLLSGFLPEPTMFFYDTC